jgi:hypothetical protein
VYLKEIVKNQQHSLNNLTDRIASLEANQPMDLSADINTLNTSVDEVNNSVNSLDARINLIENIIGVNQSSESSQSSSSVSFVSELSSQLQNLLDQFTELFASLGLSKENDTLTVSSNLSVMGNTTLSNLTITGDLMAGQLKIDSIENSLNINAPACYNNDTQTLNSELCEAQTIYLQKNLSGNVNLFDGKVVIQPNGDMLVDGNFKAKKVTADEYSVTETSQMTGTAVLGANSHFVTISNPNIKSNSKVFVTPTTSTNGQSLIVSEKVENTSFTVSIDNTSGQPIDFDWWILNVN